MCNITLSHTLQSSSQQPVFSRGVFYFWCLKAVTRNVVGVLCYSLLSFSFYMQTLNILLITNQIQDLNLYFSLSHTHTLYLSISLTHWLAPLFAPFYMSTSRDMMTLQNTCTKNYETFSSPKVNLMMSPRFPSCLCE